MIQLGEARTALVGGMESMSQAPHVIRGARSGFALGEGKLEDSLMVALLDTYCNTPMAGTAENLARKFEIPRDEQDRYALRSQQEAKRAKDAGVFAEEIVAVEVKSRKGSTQVTDDDHPRPETTLEGLAKLKPAFARDGFVTAGNASGIVDGAAALVIAGEEFVKQKDLKPMGRIVSWAYAGVEPEIITSAKGMANGSPIGWTIANKEVANAVGTLTFSTFGGNPFACAVGYTVVKTMEQEKIPENAAKIGEYLQNGLKEQLADNKHVIGIRGKGLMIGVELDTPARDLPRIGLAHHLLFNIVSDRTIRILPPLTLTREEADEIIVRLKKTLEDFFKQK
jgi:hypothetical protein